MDMRHCIATIGASLLLAGTASGIVLHVDDDGTATFNTIQDAIDYANINDEILVWPGTYTSAHPDYVISTRGKGIVINSKGGPSVTIIDGQGTRRGIYCPPGDPGEPVISGFTIANGTAPGGGGIYCAGSGSYPTFDNCIITNCTATEWYGGGGVLCDGASAPVFNNCMISGNATTYDSTLSDGGGLYCTDNSHVTLNGSTVSGNTSISEAGGCKVQWDSILDMNNCTISDNSGTTGGGISVTHGAVTNLTNCVIRENVAGRGGGIECAGSKITCTGCTIENNSSVDGIGGGVSLINCLETHTPTFTNCTIRDNHANGSSGMSGGGIAADRSSLIITGGLIEDNTAHSGSGITGGGSPAQGTFTISGCTIQNNTATGSDGGGIDCGFPANSITDCIFHGNSAAGSGGALHKYGGSGSSVSGCTFTGNSAGNNGGGLSWSSNDSLSITECDFSGNSAQNGGGMDIGGATLLNCTINDNSASNQGGGIYAYTGNAAPTLSGCTVSGNSAGSQGGGIRSYYGVPLENTIFCGNTPDQVVPSWFDNGGNTVEEECPSDCTGDTNGDGSVNVIDLLAVIGAWGTCTDCDEDITGSDGLPDGSVNVLDLLAVIASWGECS